MSLTFFTNDRSGNLWAFNPSTLPTSLTGTAYNSFLPGAANAGLALDVTNLKMYLPGIFTGSGVELVVASVSGTPPTAPTAVSTATMPGAFRPLKAAWDSTNGRIYIADPAVGLTAIDTSTYAQTLYVPPGAGNIKAQGVCYDSVNNAVYTCFQNSSNQDCLAIYNAVAMTPIASSPVLLPSLALSNSYTSITYDSANDYVLITANNPLGGLTVLSVMSGPFSPITGSPFQTGGTDSRGVTYINTGTQKMYVVCNFGSNNLGVFNASGSTPSLVSGSPYPTGASPNSVIYDGSTYLWVTNFNGLNGALSIYTLGSYALTQLTASPFMPGVQFIEIALHT